MELGSVGFLPTKTSTVACILFCLEAPGPDYSPVPLHICLAASFLSVVPSLCFLFFFSFSAVSLLLPRRFFFVVEVFFRGVCRFVTAASSPFPVFSVLLPLPSLCAHKIF